MCIVFTELLVRFLPIVMYAHVNIKELIVCSFVHSTSNKNLHCHRYGSSISGHLLSV